MTRAAQGMTSHASIASIHNEEVMFSSHGFIKVLGRNHHIEEVTWERENEIREKYPELVQEFETFKDESSLKVYNVTFRYLKKHLNYSFSNIS